MLETTARRHIPLLGAALGDALGAGVEGGQALERAFREDPEGVGRRFMPYSPFGFEQGGLTDDTQMAWAALVELGRGRPDLSTGDGRLEYARRVGSAYRAWHRSEPPDVGSATHLALLRDAVDGGWRSWDGGESAGNGSLMRATAPFAAGYRGEPLRVAAALDSALTHPDPRCVAACVWYSATLESAMRLDTPERMGEAMEEGIKALDSASPTPWLAPTVSDAAEPWRAFTSRWTDACQTVRTAVRKSRDGEHVDCQREPWEAWPTGYVISSLAQAAWAAQQGDRADEALRLAVVNGGRDADTIGAIAGGLVGARFGRRALEHWATLPLGEMRLGHTWPGVPAQGSFVELLNRHGRDQGAGSQGPVTPTGPGPAAGPGRSPRA